MRGLHPKIASEPLGHSKVGIALNLYGHVLPNMQTDAAAAVDAALRVALNKPGSKGRNSVAGAHFGGAPDMTEKLINQGFAGLAQR